MEQLDLFVAPQAPPVVLGCEVGRHGILIDSEPQDLGACVNIDHVCGSCGTCVSVTSWTKAAYVKKHGLPK